MTSPEKDVPQDESQEDQTQEPQTESTDLNDEELDEVSGGMRSATGQPVHAPTDTQWSVGVGPKSNP